jgi:radical SAM enzyme (TIGR01210 family)
VIGTTADQRIRKLRAPKPWVDPWHAHGSLVEEERRPDGRIERALTVFLAGAECPYTCSFCDLWRWTTDGPTPPGALATQLREVLDATPPPLPERVKLYNASNFFDQRAVPVQDLPAIAELAAPFGGLTVESHARMVGPRTVEFAKMLSGTLEVAIGLETTHPTAIQHINKRLSLTRFDSASGYLADHGIALRVFVLLNAPYVPADETVGWTVRAVEYAARRGASVVAIIPVRGGNGEMERLRALGHFTPPTLSGLEDALDRCLHVAPTVVTADLWDAAKLATCTACSASRIERLARLNLTGRAEPRVTCSACDGR